MQNAVVSAGGVRDRDQGVELRGCYQYGQCCAAARDCYQELCGACLSSQKERLREK